MENLAYFRFSPDGQRIVAACRVGGQFGLQTSNVIEGAWSRFTFQSGTASAPISSPDSRQIVFHADPPSNLYMKAADGAGTEQRITNSPNRQFPSDWSRDGRSILYYELSPDLQRDIWTMPVGPDGKPEPAKARPYLRTRANEFLARFSPEANPHWVAYVSDELGRNEIFVQAFPEPRGKWQISNGGGLFPEWSPGGRVSPDSKLMAVSLQFSSDAIQPSAPRELFRLPDDDFIVSPYAVSPDGKRFLVKSSTNQASKHLEVIVNWPALLKPAAK